MTRIQKLLLVSFVMLWFCGCDQQDPSKDGVPKDKFDTKWTDPKVEPTAEPEVKKPSSFFTGPSAGSGNVPQVVQNNGHNCGPASMQAIYASYGKNIDQNSIEPHVYEPGGSYPSKMADHFRKNGFPNTRMIEKSGDSLDALAQRVQSHGPQIVRVRPVGGSLDYFYPSSLNPGKSGSRWTGDGFSRSSSNGHFMVLTGFTSSGDVKLMDPASSQLGNVVAQRSWFQKYWFDSIDVSK